MEDQIMKSKKFFRQFTALLIYFLLCTMIFCTIDQKNNKAVYDAYDLRMNGKAEVAHAMLDSILTADPSNALAKYELARTLLHYLPMEKMGVNRFEFIDTLLIITESAMEMDPENTLFYPFANVIYDFKTWFSQDSLETLKYQQKKYEIFEKELELNPDDPELLLSKLEWYVTEPELTNSNATILEELTKKIEASDEVMGVKARSMVEEKQVTVDRCLELTEKYPDNATAEDLSGMAYLNSGETLKAFECINKSIKLDPEMGAQVPWMMRYLVFSAGQEQVSEIDYDLIAEELAGTYFESQPPNPMKAFVIACQARIKEITGDQEKSDELWKEAMALDPYTPEYPLDPALELFTPLAEK